MIVSGRSPITPECQIIAPGGDTQVDQLIISSLQVYRRNENEIRKIQCLANRRNLARLTLINGTAQTIGPISIQVQLDAQEPLRSSIETLVSGAEHSVEIDIPGQIRVGNHSASAIVQYKNDGAEASLSQSNEFECVNP